MQRWWPAEYDTTHIGCILLFPHANTTFDGTAIATTTTTTTTNGCSENELLLRNAQNAVLDVILAIAINGKENVFVFCQDTNHQQLLVRIIQERQQKDATIAVPPYVLIDDNSSSSSSLLRKFSGSRDGSASTGESSIYIMICDSNDTWVRDTGPTFVVVSEVDADVVKVDTNNDISHTGGTNKHLLGIDWEFNAYGGKDDGCYYPYDTDERIASTIIQSFRQLQSLLSDTNINHDGIASPFSSTTSWNVMHEKVSNLILEGGSIHTDGEGTIITTEECLLNKNRNPNLSKEQIETIILQATGCSKMIWLPKGLAYDDDTNGHIDNWCCFTSPTNVVLTWTDDEMNDPINFQNCRISYDFLLGSTDAKNRRLVVHKLYLPSPIYFDTGISSISDDIESSAVPAVVQRIIGTRMAASYVNFYIANNAIIVPQFGDAIYDPLAINVLQTLYPSKQICGITSSRHILYGGGNIHCITQQVPGI